MRSRLKLKILAGFLLLVALLVAAGSVSIIEFSKLSHSVTALIEDNYKTIEASKTMLEALEREDSGTLLLLLGDLEDGRKTIISADSAFIAAFEKAKNNITEIGEEDHVRNVENYYTIYRQNWTDLFSTAHKIEDDKNWYYSNIHQSFLDVKKAVNQLMSLNQISMYDEATILKDKSHRAIMPGIVAIVGALIFSVILSFFISRYYVSPLNEITNAVKAFGSRDKSIRTNIKTNDDIKRLETAINDLISRIEKYHEQKSK